MNRIGAAFRRFLEKPAGQNMGLAAVFLAAGLLLTAFGERMPLAGGLGYDGLEYGRWAMEFDAVLDGRVPVSTYRVFRMLPSAAAYGGLRLVGAALTPENVIRFFQVYNLGLLCLAVAAWGATADALSLSRRGKLLGFLGLFCNHAILKFNFYYPVLTDVSGYACAVFLLWAFARSKPWWAALITLAGGFCWPPLLIYGAVVLLFPRRDQTPGTPSRLAGGVAAAVAAVGYGVLAATPLTGLTPHYPLAAAVVMAYLGLAAYCLFASPYRLGPMLGRATTPGRLVLLGAALASALGGKLLLDRLVVRAADGGFFNLPLWDMIPVYLRTTCIPLSTRFPGEFAVAHVLYFGPLLFFAGLFPARTAAAAGRLGLGFFLLTLVATVHAIMPLSRQWLAGYPVLALAVVWAMEDVPLSRGFLPFFAVLSLLLSKVWMLFNLTRPAGLVDSGHDKALAWEAGLSFEHYVSSTGRWMAFEWYAVQGMLLLFIFICYYWYFNGGGGKGPVRGGQAPGGGGAFPGRSGRQG